MTNSIVGDAEDDSISGKPIQFLQMYANIKTGGSAGGNIIPQLFIRQQPLSNNEMIEGGDDSADDVIEKRQRFTKEIFRVVQSSFNNDNKAKNCRKRIFKCSRWGCGRSTALRGKKGIKQGDVGNKPINQQPNFMTLHK